MEGPGATRNGRKLQRVVGSRLLHSSIPQSPKEAIAIPLLGRRLESAFSVGKEVFLVLGGKSTVLAVLPKEKQAEEKPPDTDNNSPISVTTTTTHQYHKPMALRMHFGMNGSLTVRTPRQSSKLAPWRIRDTTTSKITLTFGNKEDTVEFLVETVASTCTMVSAAVAVSKLVRLQPRDVCGSEFDPQAVSSAIVEKRRTSMICDALLDQERFPGVGNIIKIEGLHRAKIHPRTKVQQLSNTKLLEGIQECRNYAMEWLAHGRAPTKLVYNQTVCGSCRSSRVRMVKMGKDLSRVTFWCEQCQPLGGLEKQEESLSDKNETASFVAKSTTPRQEQPLLQFQHSCPQHGSKRIVLRRVRNQSSPNLHRLFRTCRVHGCPYFSWADAQFPSCKCGGSITSNANTSSSSGSNSNKAVLKVSKTERTGGRWFFSCRRAAGNLPHKPGGSGCSFFQWATPAQLAPLAHDLSPLT